MSMPLRRTDKQMDEARMREMVSSAYCGRLATVGPDGYPYIVPLLFVFMEGQIYTHNSAAPGHLRRNVDFDSRVCFEIDQPGEVFGYGRFECDTSLSYSSIIAFGTVRTIEDRQEKARFCTELMTKYAAHVQGRPKNVFPRLDQIAVYAIAISSMTGKQAALPPMAEQWPARDRTKSASA